MPKINYLAGEALNRRWPEWLSAIGNIGPELWDLVGALKGWSYWHFATHGTFSWADARQSGLYMSGPVLLTVGKLQETDGLGRPRLVVLSASALGAAGVLGTLWTVADMASVLLVAKFYELHLGDGLAPTTALRRAQLWLREATNANLAAYAASAARQGRLQRRHLSEIEADLSEEGLERSRNDAAIQWLPPSEGKPEHVTAGKQAPVTAKRLARPYAHPFYWAGFIYTGL